MIDFLIDMAIKEPVLHGVRPVFDRKGAVEQAFTSK